jgi:hypothetical protein
MVYKKCQLLAAPSWFDVKRKLKVASLRVPFVSEHFSYKIIKQGTHKMPLVVRLVSATLIKSLNIYRTGF